MEPENAVDADVRAEGAREALEAAADALIEAERGGYVFLGEPHERVPWRQVAKWLRDRAAALSPDSGSGEGA
jgi:hypothetical protein